MQESVNADPWGKPYKMFRRKFRPTMTEPFLNTMANMELAVNELFPRSPDAVDRSMVVEQENDIVQPFTR